MVGLIVVGALVARIMIPIFAVDVFFICGLRFV
jgi:hypothetical protein